MARKTNLQKLLDTPGVKESMANNRAIWILVHSHYQLKACGDYQGAELSRTFAGNKEALVQYMIPRVFRGV
jgi:hypothetical protein